MRTIMHGCILLVCAVLLSAWAGEEREDNSALALAPGLSFTLIDAVSDGDIRPLIDNDVIALNVVGNELSIRADVTVAGHRSVVFELNGATLPAESVQPYSLSGDVNGNYRPWTPAPGTYQVTARAYSGLNGSGTLLVQSSVSLEVVASAPASPCQVLGERRQWHRVEVRCSGPSASETSSGTFTDLRMNVTFTAGTTSLVIPGHFAADGNAGESGARTGTTWRAYFMPPSTGVWSFAVSMRSGAGIAVNPAANAGAPVAGLNGVSGTFTVSASNKSGRDLRGQGLLQHRSGERYLRFAGNGMAFVEGGVDSPENLFGYSGFDNTVKNSNVSSCKGILHDFQPHFADWRAGDPTWGGGRGKSLIGLINYLASTGVSSVYLVPMSVNGDGCDAHPWTDYNGNRRAFDVSKLDQWEVAFSHMTRSGLLIHFVTQETENDQLLNGGDLGLERRLYYREIISRFGHHPALQWNLGEENTNTAAQVKEFAAYIKAVDPYDHPVVMHTYPNEHARYDALLGDPSFNGPTLQFGDIPESASGGLYGLTLELIAESRAAGRTWFVTATEASGAQGPTPGSAVSKRQRVYWMWANVMAGGAGIEWYLKNAGSGHAYDLAVENLREFDAHWRQTSHLVRFFRDLVQGAGVDLEDLAPANNLTAITSDWVLAAPGQAYVVFLRDGGSVSLSVTGGGTYDVTWFDPRTGATTSRPAVQGSGVQSLGAPPADTTQDWVVFVHR